MTTSDAAAILRTTRVWAVVGCSPDPARDSHDVAAYLQRNGYRVVPVNPATDATEILGERVFRSVGEAAAAVGPIDVVDVFRRSDLAGAHVDEAIAIGSRAAWLQLGVRDDAAIGRAHAAGLLAVHDTCPKIELPRLR